MQKFDLTCQRIFVIVMILIIIPMGTMAALLFILVKIGLDIPDWILISSIIGTLGIAILLTVKAMKAWTSIPCEVYLSPEKIIIKLKKPSIIFARDEYESQWDKLYAVSSNYVPSKMLRFYKISFSDPSITISIDSPQIVGSGEETEFGALLMSYVEEFNNSSPVSKTTKIDTKNFYQGRGAKIFNVIIWVFIILFTIGCIIFPDKVEPWRLVQMMIFASVWFSAYYINRNKKK